MSDLDRIKKPLFDLIDSRIRPVDFHALYPANVVGQNADGSLELQPVDPRVPGHSSVPIRLGLPGCAVKVQAGSTVLLGFEGGSPAHPVATLWGSSTLTELAIGASPTKHLALAEDVTTVLNAFAAAFNAHTHTAPNGPTGTPGAAAVPKSFSTSNPVASATVKST